MMYSNGFVVAIKNDKKEVLRESKSKEVYLPFYSNYSILLKNNNNLNTAASIYIDGTDVLNGNKIFIKSNDSFDLERFCLDGNLNNGNKFKFVPLDNPNVQDPSCKDNGIILVKFQLEKKNNNIYDQNNPYGTNDSNYNPYNPYGTITNPYDFDKNNLFKFWNSNDSHVSVNYNPNSISSYSSNCGATIEGDESKQSFRKIIINELDSLVTEIKLKIKPVQNESITINNTKIKYCSSCGKKYRYNDNFCKNCGTKF